MPERGAYSRINAELLWLDGSVGRVSEFPKVVGSNPTPVEVIELRLLADALA